MEVENLKKKDISLYIDFLLDVFGFEPSEDSIEKLRKNNKVLVIKHNKSIVASAVIEERYEYVKGQKYFFLSYLGVRKDYRREGYATKIFNKIEILAKKKKIDYIELTSGNQRRQAHFFYRKNDFKIKDTTVFVKLY